MFSDVESNLVRHLSVPTLSSTNFARLVWSYLSLAQQAQSYPFTYTTNVPALLSIFAVHLRICQSAAYWYNRCAILLDLIFFFLVFSSSSFLVQLAKNKNKKIKKIYASKIETERSWTTSFWLVRQSENFIGPHNV